MISGHFGLMGSFIVISILVLLIFIKPKIHYLVKVALIPITIYYAITLFFTIPSLMGWPVYVDSMYKLPNKSFVWSINVKQPRRSDKGGIYLVLFTINNNDQPTITFNPKKIFEYDGRHKPRFFKVKYDKKLHETLIEKQKEAAKNGGMIFFSLEEMKHKFSKSKTDGDKSDEEKKEAGGGNRTNKKKEQEAFKVIKFQDQMKKG